MPPFNLDHLIEGTVQQLKVEADYFSAATSHGPEKGRLNETHLVQTLRRYLPSKFGIGTGFIVSGGDTIQQSPQCDIIIYDNINNAPFYTSSAWQIFPIEMVYAVIEVKTNTNKADIRDALEKCAKIRGMCGTEEMPNKYYLSQARVPSVSHVVHRVHSNCLPPRFYLFTYKCRSLRAAYTNFAKLSREIPDAHVHGFCTISGKETYFSGHSVGGEPSVVAGERVIPFEAQGLLKFLLFMPQALNGMLGMCDVYVRHDEIEKRGGSATFPYAPTHFDLVFAERYRGLQVPEQPPIE